MKSVPISYHDRSSIMRDIENIKSAAGKLDPGRLFLTSVAPAGTAYSSINEYYPSEEEFGFAIAEALREEYLYI